MTGSLITLSFEVLLYSSSKGGDLAKNDFTNHCIIKEYIQDFNFSQVWEVIERVITLSDFTSDSENKSNYDLTLSCAWKIIARISKNSLLISTYFQHMTHHKQQNNFCTKTGHKMYSNIITYKQKYYDSINWNNVVRII